jgi:hypothetical protein
LLWLLFDALPHRPHQSRWRLGRLLLLGLLGCCWGCSRLLKSYLLLLNSRLLLL